MLMLKNIFMPKDIKIKPDDLIIFRFPVGKGWGQVVRLKNEKAFNKKFIAECEKSDVLVKTTKTTGKPKLEKYHQFSGVSPITGM